MASEARLFCVDVAVENLTILRNIAMPENAPEFSSTSLLAQFLTFSPLRLSDGLPGTLLKDSKTDKKTVRLQTGKSALLRSERRNLIKHLKIGSLVLALVGNPAQNAPPVLLLNAQLNLSAAAAYFLENGNGVDEQGYPLKFTSAGVAEMKDEFGRKRAELQIGYRVWQLGASMDDFFMQHEHLDQRNAATAWLPTFTTDRRIDGESGDATERKHRVTTDTQTEARNLVLSDVEIQTEVDVKVASVVDEGSPSISLSGGSAKGSVASRRRSSRRVSNSIVFVSTRSLILLFFRAPQLRQCRTPQSSHLRSKARMIKASLSDNQHPTSLGYNRPVGVIEKAQFAV